MTARGSSSRLLLLVFLGCTAAPALAQDVVFDLLGPGPDYSLFGRNVAALGDVDRDGAPDLLIGAPATREYSLTYGVLHVVTGDSGRTVHRVSGNEGLGTFLAGLGDVDGDGRPDFVASNWNPEAVIVFSGRTANVIRVVLAPRTGEGFGSSLADAGDVDADGVRDLIVGAPRARTPANEAGAAYVFSGRNGNQLHAFLGSIAGDRFGGGVTGPGDLNGDGHADVAIGSTDSFKGSVHVFSGKDGTLLKLLEADGTRESFGFSLAGPGDVDRDGVPDLAVGAPDAGNNANAPFHSGAVYVFSGKTLSRIHLWRGAKAEDGLGWAVHAAGDLNRDGHADIAAAAKLADDRAFNGGLVQVFSGRDGATLLTCYGEQQNEQLGYGLAAGVDVDGDDIPDLIGGAAGYVDANRKNVGAIRVFSGRPRTLIGVPQHVSLAVGGIQDLTIRAGPSRAGLLFLFAGSATGTRPGIRLGEVLLRLTPDPYTDFFLQAQSGLMIPFVGFLDATGSARCRLVLPPLDAPALLGLALFHACLVADSTRTSFVLASDPCPLLLVK